MAKQRTMYGKDDLYVTDRSNPNVTKVVDVQKWRTNQDDIRHLPGALPIQRLTIQDGAIAPSAAFIVVDTEGGAPADDLTTINPGDLHDGMEIEIVSSDASRIVTIKPNFSHSGIRTLLNINLVINTEWPIRLKLISTDAMTYWQEIPAAITAQQSANIAQNTADIANSTAATALSAATTAQGTADVALSAAGTAQQAATVAQATADSKVSDLSVGHKVSLYWNPDLYIPVWLVDQSHFELARYVQNAQTIICRNSQSAYAPQGGTWLCYVISVRTNSTSGADVAEFILNKSCVGYYSGGQLILTTSVSDAAVIFCVQVKQ